MTVKDDDDFGLPSQRERERPCSSSFFPFFTEVMVGRKHGELSELGLVAKVA